MEVDYPDGVVIALPQMEVDKDGQGIMNVNVFWKEGCLPSPRGATQPLVE